MHDSQIEKNVLWQFFVAKQRAVEIELIRISTINYVYMKIETVLAKSNVEYLDKCVIKSMIIKYMVDK